MSFVLTVTTLEVTVGVVWADARRARLKDARIIRAFPIIITIEIRRRLCPDESRGQAVNITADRAETGTINEGSIPLTRSIDFRALTKKCK
jgi:hypothetical protein